MADYDAWGDNEYDDFDEAYAWCNYCQGSGYVYAPDYLAIQGVDRVPCEHCERGLDMVGVC